MTTFWVGVDLGQASDPTAICVLEKRALPQPVSQEPIRGDGYRPVPARYVFVGGQQVQIPKEPPSTYVGRHLQRLQLGMSYPAVVEHIATIMRDPKIAGQAKLVVDGTGVGRALVDMLRDAGLQPRAITIHGGDTVKHDGIYTRVPKRDLVGVVRMLLDSQRLKFVDSLPDAPVLKHELQNFKVKIDPETAHDGYSAWREGQHDDLVLAVALAAWAGERPVLLRPPTGASGIRGVEPPLRYK